MRTPSRPFVTPDTAVLLVPCTSVVGTHPWALGVRLSRSTSLPALDSGGSSTLLIFVDSVPV